MEYLPIIILVVSFVVMLALHVPVAICIGVATFLTFLSISTGDLDVALIMSEQIVNGIKNDGLLAIPFFIISGAFMGRGGMATRLIDFAKALVGRFPGGLGYVNVLTCMLFGSISGSAAAAVSSVGGFLIPQMKKSGYDKDFSVAITSTAATTGLLIPPSNVMIVYSLATTGVSVGTLFIAGVVPGVLCGLALMVVGGVISVKNGYGTVEKTPVKEVVRSLLSALPSLALMIVVIGGIAKGLFSATEASAVAIIYSIVLTVFIYKEVKIKEFPEIFLGAGITSAVVMILIGCSASMSKVLTEQMIPQKVSEFMLNISDSPFVLLLVINVLLLCVGTFMDMSPAILIFTPILLPVFKTISGTSDLMGVEAAKWIPIHFGIIMIANLCIGLCTPPVGTCLFLGCGVGNAKITDVARKMIPFFFAMIVVLLLLTFVPHLSIWLPKVFGMFD